MSCATLKRPLDSDLFSPNSRGPSSKRRRLATRGLFGLGPSSASSSASISRDGSPFSASASVSSSRLSPEQMQVRLRQEIKSLRRLKQLHWGLEKDGGNGGVGGGGLPGASPNRSMNPSGESPSFDSGMSKDSALFTFRQVGLICERMLAEKETALRQEYEQVLSHKLAEQYDQFVKFTHDQIQKSFEAASAPSYLS